MRISYIVALWITRDSGRLNAVILMSSTKRKNSLTIEFPFAEYEIIKLLSIFTELPMATIVRSILFKRGMTGPQRKAVNTAINREELRDSRAFIQPLARLYLGEDRGLWLEQNKQSETI